MKKHLLFVVVFVRFMLSIGHKALARQAQSHIKTESLSKQDLLLLKQAITVSAKQEEELLKLFIAKNRFLESSI